MTRQQQSIETKEKILKSVQELLASTEVDKIKIRDICKKADVSLGTFYIYFSCKEEAILYIYRACDANFENLQMTDDPEENIQLILRTYFQMVDLENLSFDRHLYIFHLKHYDSYFFDEERPVFKLLHQQIALLAKGCDAKSITWHILDFIRGRIYNLCIRFDQDTTNWVNEQLSLTWQYVRFMLQDVNFPKGSSSIK